MEKNYRIYRYTNILNGMKYVGKTHQKYQSIRAGKDGKGYLKCTAFGDAIREFGWANFKYEVLEDDLSFEEADERERYWIGKENSLWPNGYNLEDGGEHNSICERTRQRLSEVRRGEKHPLYGKHPTLESRRKMSIQKNKKVLQFTEEGQFVAEYSSALDALHQTGICNSNIGKVCLGERKTAGGYIWKFA